MFGLKIKNDIVEGPWADQITDSALREQIQTEYRQRYCKQPTPLTHPEQYDPLDPPQGWRYDPYYEIWVQL
jgi:hypothetical protein